MFNVLLIDDEETVKRSLRKIIESKAPGFAVIGEAEDGAQGLERIGELRPDLVITDIRMPVMDGLELAQALRARGDAIELLIVSGHDQFQYARQALRFGVVDYLLKPLVPADVVAALGRTGDKIRLARQEALDINGWLIAQRSRIGHLAHAVWMLQEERSFGLLAELERDVPSPRGAENRTRPYMTALMMSLHAELARLAEGQWEPVQARAPLPGQADRTDWQGHVRELIDAFRSSRNFGVHHLVMKAVAYIDDRYTEETLSLSEIAEHVGVSPSHFSKCFKAELGVSYTDYLTELRMERAVRLLRDPSAKVYEVAQQVGYGDYSHFTKLFKKKYGFSPGQTRGLAGRSEE
ncbi:response regulator [Paenibacillus hemerocallicola]|uniref:Response regulator n=1 Tax=Paenibacillus hemerocallicola TaxID=1172614 RepID=A0A5C4T5X7_9BACL|nr:response regulator [Paenibacillus hemerocallicola]TNJ63727.1 response regulator [Paenibacillus hemerocallicola]